MKLHHGTPEEAGMSSERVQLVRDVAKSWVDDGITPSLVVLAARRGVIVLHEAFGALTPEADSPPLQLDTVFPLASISKPITATAIMILLEEGKLGLNRPVTTYIPELTGEGTDAVMVHHLLTHTSGFKENDLYEHAERSKRARKIPPVEETQNPRIHKYLNLLYDAPLSVPPGKEMAYSSYGINLLGEIVRRTSGTSLADFGRKRIFDPLGMKDTFFVVPDSDRQRIVVRPNATWATLTENEHNSWLETYRPGSRIHWAHGGVYSAAIDMAVFGQMFLNHGSPVTPMRKAAVGQ